MSLTFVRKKDFLLGQTLHFEFMFPGLCLLTFACRLDRNQIYDRFFTLFTDPVIHVLVGPMAFFKAFSAGLYLLPLDTVARNMPICHDLRERLFDWFYTYD